MSKVALAGNASGTGTFTIASPNSNTDRTLTLPDEAGMVLTSASSITQNSGPAFFAKRASSVQSVSVTTWTKVLFETALINVDSCYSTSTSEFTPTTAGYYKIGAEAEFNNVSGGMLLAIYKNGSSIYAGGATGGAVSVCQVDGLIYMNGTTDYVEVRAYTTTNMTGVYNGTVSKFFGFLVRT